MKQTEIIQGKHKAVYTHSLHEVTYVSPETEVIFTCKVPHNWGVTRVTQFIFKLFKESTG